jgi:tRNA A-37 threonylcarbamoyl transferase component Bud32
MLAGVAQVDQSQNSIIQDEDSIRVLKAGALRWIVRAQFFNRTLHRIVEEPDAFLRDPRMHFKNYSLVTIARVPPMAAEERGLVVRRLNYGRITHRLRDFVRTSRARRAFNSGLQLERDAIRTPRMIAVGEWRRLGWPMRAYVVTEEVAGAISVGRFFKQKGFLPRRVVYESAELIARLHNAGFSHRDLKDTNMLLDARLTPWVIDLDGVKYRRSVSTHRAILDLAVLARCFRAHAPVLRWSGARFLKSYCQMRGMGNEFRNLASRLVRKTEPK